MVKLARMSLGDRRPCRVVGGGSAARIRGQEGMDELAAIIKGYTSLKTAAGIVYPVYAGLRVRAGVVQRGESLCSACQCTGHGRRGIYRTDAQVVARWDTYRARCSLRGVPVKQRVA